MLGHSVVALALAAVGTQYASAQVTSIFLPGFDPQPISMTEVGVGSDGKTTFLLGAGTPTASGEDVGIPTSASFTYVAGPSDVAWYMELDGVKAQDVCTIGADGNAVCVESGGDQSKTFTETVPAAAGFPVQFAGATAASTAAGASNTGGASSGASSPLGSNTGSASQTSKAASSGVSATGSSAVSPSPSNGAMTLASSGLAALGAPAVLVALCSTVF